MVFMIEVLIENALIKLNQLGTDYQGLQEEEEICKNKMQHSLSVHTKQELSNMIAYIHQEKLKILDEMIQLNINVQQYNQQKNSINKVVFTPSNRVK